jgi:hypothetical protein
MASILRPDKKEAGGNDEHKTLLGAWIAVGFSLCIYSFLYKDNPFSNWVNTFCWGFDGLPAHHHAL